MIPEGVVRFGIRTFLFLSLFRFALESSQSPTPLARETFFISFVLCYLWVTRLIGNLKLRYQDRQNLFTIFLLLQVSQAPAFLYGIYENFCMQDLYLLQGYWNLSLVVKAAGSIFLFFPLCCLLLFLEKDPKEGNPQILNIMSVVLALGLSSSNSLSHPIFVGLSLFLASVFYLSESRVGTYQGAIACESWIPAVLLLCSFSYLEGGELLSIALGVFTISLSPRGKSWWKKSEGALVFDLGLFHAFLSGVILLLFGAGGFLSLQGGFLLVAFFAPRFPVRLPTILDGLLIVLFATVCLSLEFTHSHQRFLLLFFILSFRLFFYYLASSRWTRLLIGGFLFYYSVSQFDPIVQEANGSVPELLSLGSSMRVQEKGSVLYKSFEDSRPRKKGRHLYYNWLSPVQERQQAYFFHWLPSGVKGPDSLFEYISLRRLKTEVSKKKVGLLMRGDLPIYAHFSMHELFYSNQMQQWYEFFHGKQVHMELVLTARQYPMKKLRSILEGFLKVYPMAKVQLGLNRIIITDSVFWEPDLLQAQMYLRNFLVLTQDYSIFHRLELLEKLKELEWSHEFEKEPPGPKELRKRAVRCFQAGFRELALKLVERDLERDSLNEELKYFRLILKGKQTQHQDFELFGEYLLDPFKAMNDLDEHSLYRVLFPLNLYHLPISLKLNLKALVQAPPENQFLYLRVLLGMNLLEEARQLVQNTQMKPRFQRDFELIRTLYEKLGLPEAASFYQI